MIVFGITNQVGGQRKEMGEGMGEEYALFAIIKG